MAFAYDALNKCKLDKIFFLVEPRPRRKQGVKSHLHRSEMVGLAIENEPKFSSIILRQQRFTAEKTLPVLMELFKGAKIHMLMGDDVLAHLAEWPHVEVLLKNVQFDVGLRTQQKEETKRRLEILQRTRGFAVEYKLFNVSKPKISSSTIRKDVKSGKKPTGLSTKVYEYMKANKLYAEAEDSDNDPSNITL